MANTNRRNSNAAAEPTIQSRRVVGHCPPGDSPALRFSRYDRVGPKDPPESLAGTSTRTKANRKSPPELLGTREEVAALSSPNVPPDSQEATAEPPANFQEATAQLPPIAPELPPFCEQSPKGTMPTLVPLPASGITPAENRHYPEQRNWNPYFTPPKLIKASSLGKGDNMTPLDVRSPAGAMPEQVLFAEKNI